MKYPGHLGDGVEFLSIMPVCDGSRKGVDGRLIRVDGSSVQSLIKPCRVRDWVERSVISCLPRAVNLRPNHRHWQNKWRVVREQAAVKLPEPHRRVF